MKCAIVGRDLAVKVANRLMAEGWMTYSHPYYCGIGLLFLDGAFVYVQVGDWLYPTLEQAIEMEARGESECQVFKNAESFIEWLSRQSDESLYGHELDDRWLRGNQRVTISRLREFVQDNSSELGGASSPEK